MRAVPWSFIASVFLAGCAGHAASTGSGPTPAARPAAASAAPANTVRYAPGSSHYRVQQTVHTHQEAMGNVTDIDASSSLLLSAATAAGGDGNLESSYTVDSVSLTTTAGNGNLLDPLRGKTFRTTTTPQGKFVSYVAPDSSISTLQIRDMFREFVPQVPVGALTDGMTWTDTVATPPVSNQGMTVRTQAIRTHHVVGWETHDGQRALHIATSGTVTLAGEGEQNGTPLTLTGTGIASADRFVSASGVYLGATSSDSTNLTVSVVTMGMEIPIRQVRHTTVTRLP